MIRAVGLQTAPRKRDPDKQPGRVLVGLGLRQRFLLAQDIRKYP